MLPIPCNKSILNGLLGREHCGAGRPRDIWKVFSVSWEGEVFGAQLKSCLNLIKVSVERDGL